MTPGPWALRGRQIRAENGLGRHVADYMVDAEDGHTLAAAPSLEWALRGLLDRLARRDGDAYGEIVRVEVFSDAAEDALDLLTALDSARRRQRDLGGAERFLCRKCGEEFDGALHEGSCGEDDP